MIHEFHKKILNIGETYSLVRKLSCIDGSNLGVSVLDRVMYNAETLPPLGKEYWWLLFIGRDGERPMQFMLLIFRKHGRRVRFNGKEMALREIAADDQALLNYGVSLALRRAVGLEKNGGRTCRRPRSSTSRSS